MASSGSIPKLAKIPISNEQYELLKKICNTEDFLQNLKKKKKLRFELERVLFKI